MQKCELYSKIKHMVIMAENNFDKNWHHIKWGEKSKSIIYVGIGDGKVTY